MRINDFHNISEIDEIIFTLEQTIKLVKEGIINGKVIIRVSN